MSVWLKNRFDLATGVPRNGFHYYPHFSSIAFHNAFPPIVGGFILKKTGRFECGGGRGREITFVVLSNQDKSCKRTFESSQVKKKKKTICNGKK